jgi:hypothetical protein
MALYCVASGDMLASKRLSHGPVVGLHPCCLPYTYAVVSEAEVGFWHIERILDYNVIRGGHSGPVCALYACSGGLVRSLHSTPHK